MAASILMYWYVDDVQYTFPSHTTWTAMLNYDSSYPWIVSDGYVYSKDNSCIMCDSTGTPVNANDYVGCIDEDLNGELDTEIPRYYLIELNPIPANYTLVNGTAYELKSGKTLVNGTAYNIGIEQITLITFTTNHYLGNNIRTYTAEEGMTWAEWLNSAYNTSPSSAPFDSNGTIYYQSGVMLGYNNVAVKSTDVIVNGGAYVGMGVCCFVAGTEVQVSLNGDTKPIECIQKNDGVVSYNINTNQNYLACVQRLVINPTSVNMAKVMLDTGEVLEMTDYHPIYTENGWRSITDRQYDELVVGDVVKTVTGWSKIVSIALYRLPKPITTYTLSVVNYDECPDEDANDNFYANNIMVHNAACPM